MKNTLSTFSFYRLFIWQFFVIVWILLLGYGIFVNNTHFSGERTLYIVDTSLSMAVEDIWNSTDTITRSRLDRAKSLILASSFSGEVAVIWYARSPALLLPFTASVESFSRTIQNLSITPSFGGSDILSAFSLVDTLYRGNMIPLHIVLLTDGGNTIPASIFPILPPLSDLKIVGIGSDIWWRMPLGYDHSGARRYKVYENQEVIVPYDPVFLEKLQKQYHASLVRIENSSDMGISWDGKWFFASFGFWDCLFLFLGVICLIFGYLFHPYRSLLWKK